MHSTAALYKLIKVIAPPPEIHVRIQAKHLQLERKIFIDDTEYKSAKFQGRSYKQAKKTLETKKREIKFYKRSSRKLPEKIDAADTREKILADNDADV